MAHTPVLLSEAIELMQISDKCKVIDATFGDGGHTKAILNYNQTCNVFGVDRDELAATQAKIVESQYPERFRFLCSRFSLLPELFQNTEKFDSVLFDFGVSSSQIDDYNRGFSFMRDGPLDMRMSGTDTITAFDIVNTYSQKDIADIIYNYGEERKSREIAKRIVEARKVSSITTTLQLKNIINDALHNKKFSKIDNATKTFQALRIYINQELEEISSALAALPLILKHGARIVTISFHALESRLVKEWQRNNSNTIKKINKKVIKPSREEIIQNPRSRSAVLRGFIYE
ncbi:MAG: 16S rRNA (cytosine(1402)-N(4))-methyltransferase RsmH [Holosporales bacterium]|jgi:16S rRNA (cytosine1402-N4)-methyltransferase|nr:16S rRNA (cytosine(1402)-N(4))-methyltransferase RsmH [Holosporales bacterium]